MSIIRSREIIICLQWNTAHFSKFIFYLTMKKKIILYSEYLKIAVTAKNIINPSYNREGSVARSNNVRYFARKRTTLSKVSEFLKHMGYIFLSNIKSTHVQSVPGQKLNITRGNID